MKVIQFELGNTYYTIRSLKYNIIFNQLYTVAFGNGVEIVLHKNII